MIKDGIKIKGIPTTHNGDNVIGFTNANFLADFTNVDSASLSTWYEKDPMSTYLGVIQAVGAEKSVAFPLLESVLGGAGHITVDGVGGRFTYDMPVNASHGVYTTVDKSNQPNPGIAGSVFEIVLSRKFAPGDVLTYDAQGSHNIIVSADYPVRQVGSDFLHTVKYLAPSAKAWYPSDKLRAGIQYFKIHHLAGEFSTQFSGITAFNPVSMIRSEFTLGNHRGVEASATMYGGDRLLSGLTKNSTMFLEEAKRQIESWGKLPNGEKINAVFLTNRFQDPKTGVWKLNQGNMKVMSAMEYLAFAELAKIEDTGLMFQRSGLIEDNNSVIRANEGLWHQLMRGYTIGYSRPGGLKLSHLRNAVEYVHRNNQGMPIEKRRTRFKAGSMAYENALALVQNEFNLQVQNLAPLLGTDRALPSNPISGTLDALKLQLVRAVSCFLPGMGYVEFQHEPSLDVMPMTDVQSQGYNGNGKPWTAYSLYIEDITDAAASNAYTSKPNYGSGVKLIKPGTNLYYITPEQGSLHWGYEGGRWDYRKSANIISSQPKLAQTFFCHSISALWVSDLSKILLLHLEQ
jgi:hypothetical protein